MTNNRRSDDRDQSAESSPTAHLLDELQLYGHRPFEDEPDPRPLPDPKQLHGALADIFDALVGTLSDTRLEPDLSDLLWSVVNLFHRQIERIERVLDSNESDQRRSQREQDGSEIRSVELERAIAQGLTRSSAAIASSSCATPQRTSTKSMPASRGGHAPARWSAAAPSPPR